MTLRTVRPHTNFSAAMVALALAILCRGVPAIEPAEDRRFEPIAGQTFPARDSLDPGEEASAEAKQCLAGLCWEPATFSVTCDDPTDSAHGDLLVRFPTAVPSGDAINDRVAMEWFRPRNEDGRTLDSARAVVVVHESGSEMKVGRLIARGLRQQGLHAFLIHLPYYGQRRTEQRGHRDAKLIPMMRQAIADVRRARDAVAVLPTVDDNHIALQGTSLGGLVAATTAGLDSGYDSIYLLLAGGQLYDMIQNGKRDTARIREQLAETGLQGDRLKELAWSIEPTRLLHRADPQTTWLFSGMFDTVVPPRNAMALAKAARLDDRHHVRLPANHYTGIVYLPMVLAHIHREVSK